MLSWYLSMCNLYNTGASALQCHSLIVLGERHIRDWVRKWHPGVHKMRFHYHKVLHKKYVIKYEKYVMTSKKVWKVCYDIKKVWNNVKMHVITLKIMS